MLIIYLEYAQPWGSPGTPSKPPRTNAFKNCTEKGWRRCQVASLDIPWMHVQQNHFLEYLHIFALYKLALPVPLAAAHELSRYDLMGSDTYWPIGKSSSYLFGGCTCHSQYASSFSWSCKEGIILAQKMQKMTRMGWESCLHFTDLAPAHWHRFYRTSGQFILQKLS